ncbi:MAG: hypothetical protein C0500_15265, partial [Sphingobium sp.]|nr:hypothetical protein [Sphingobium sp.]
HEESNMTTESDPAPKDRGNHKPMGASAALMLIDVARARGASVEARARELIDQNERGAISAEAAREALMIALADHQRAQTSGISNMRLGGDATFDNPEFLARSIEDGLYARMSGQAPSEPGRQFANLSIVDVCRELLVAQGDHDARRMAPAQVLQRATRGGGGGYFERKGGMHSTSDFPQLLGNATGRFLIDQFGEMESPLKAIARMRSASDFKTISGVQLSGIGKLDKIVEGGEIKRGTLSERAESFKVETFSKIFSLSREAMINDDLGSFSDTVRIMARAGAETEAAILAGLLNSNPLLADGKAVFHADHGNLAASGALPDVTTLSAARLAMRNQVDLDGSTPYPTDPRYLVVSSKNETVGEQLLSTIAANSVSAVNPFSQRLELLVDPRLSANPWYVFGAPNVSPGLEYAYLNGATGPQIEMSPGWNTLGEEYRCTLDFGAGWTEHRAAYRNPGA